MLNVFGKWVGAVAIVLSVVGAQGANAFWFGHDNDDDDDHRVKVTEIRSGPADYHKVYGSIVNTVVTIEDFWLRTADGQVFKVATNYMTIDLQDLTKFGRGLLIDTRKLVLPRGVTELDVVEIETKIVNIKGRDNQILWGRGGTPYDGAKCKLSTPKFLNFFTSPATPLGFKMGKDEYLVKIDFSALQSIQLDVVTKIIQHQECDCDDRCKNVGRPKPGKTQLRCDLANRRQSINRIVRKVDEF